MAKPIRKKKAKLKKTGIFAAQKNIPHTLFKKHFDRGDIPLNVDCEGAKRKVGFLMC